MFIVEEWSLDWVGATWMKKRLQSVEKTQDTR